jgi:transketolase
MALTDSSTGQVVREYTIAQLIEAARLMRGYDLVALCAAGSGHAGGTLSIMDITAALYLKAADLDPQNPNWSDRDRIVWSAGHKAPSLYLGLTFAGFFPVEDVVTLRKLGSPFQGHPHWLIARRGSVEWFTRTGSQHRGRHGARRQAGRQQAHRHRRRRAGAGRQAARARHLRHFRGGPQLDQLRVSVCYGNFNVLVAGAHGGVSVGPDGATHQALEDLLAVCGLPNMVAVVPCDSLETRKATDYLLLRHVGPKYIRFAREATPVVTTPETPFVFGLANVIRFRGEQPNFVDAFATTLASDYPNEEEDLSIIAGGPMVPEAMRAAWIPSAIPERPGS